MQKVAYSYLLLYNSLYKVKNKRTKKNIEEGVREINQITKTIEYYDNMAKNFVEDTVSVDFKEIQDKFLKLLKEGDSVLDFGCCSGRDTKYFIEKNMKVDAIDGSVELCKIAQKYTGINVRPMLFQQLDEEEKYDGIWACSSILHLPKKELKSVFEKMLKALKKGGIIYTSFKDGTFEGERNGRYFTDFTIQDFRKFVSNLEELSIEEYWITNDVRQGRGDEKWLNIILRKI